MVFDNLAGTQKAASHQSCSVGMLVKWDTDGHTGHTLDNQMFLHFLLHTGLKALAGSKPKKERNYSSVQLLGFFVTQKVLVRNAEKGPSCHSLQENVYIIYSVQYTVYTLNCSKWSKVDYGSVLRGRYLGTSSTTTVWEPTRRAMRSSDMVHSEYWLTQMHPPYRKHR